MRGTRGGGQKPIFHAAHPHRVDAGFALKGELVSALSKFQA